MIGQRCDSYLPCDVYSAGIVLFSLMTGGKLPFLEDPSKDIPQNKYSEYLNLKVNFYEKRSQFWSYHARSLKTTSSFFSKQLRDLLYKMLAKKPEDRITIKQVMKHTWFEGEIYDD